MSDESDAARSWGSLIRALRTKHGVSQRNLARWSGTNRSTLRRMENGTCLGMLDDIEAMLAALGYELDAIPIEQKPLGNQTPATASQPTRSQLAMQRLLSPGVPWPG